MNGHTRNAIVRRYEIGFKPRAICEEFGIDLVTLAIALVHGGRFANYKVAMQTIRKCR